MAAGLREARPGPAWWEARRMSALAGRWECRRRIPSRRGEAVAIGMCGRRAPWLDGGIQRDQENGGAVGSKIGWFKIIKVMWLHHMLEK